MAEPHANDPVIRRLEEKINSNERRLAELTRALYGHPELGQRGFREEVRQELQDVKQELRDTRAICEALRQERREELAERRGMKRIVGYTGVSNILTLLTIIALFITIWQSGYFGG